MPNFPCYFTIHLAKLLGRKSIEDMTRFLKHLTTLYFTGIYFPLLKLCTQYSRKSIFKFPDIFSTRNLLEDLLDMSPSKELPTSTWLVMLSCAKLQPNCSLCFERGSFIVQKTGREEVKRSKTVNRGWRIHTKSLRTNKINKSKSARVVTEDSKVAGRFLEPAREDALSILSFLPHIIFFVLVWHGYFFWWSITTSNTRRLKLW